MLKIYKHYETLFTIIDNLKLELYLKGLPYTNAIKVMWVVTVKLFLFLTVCQFSLKFKYYYHYYY